MKLKSFKIENLFNTFEHQIAINNEAGITIVIGENGIGKTVILEIIEAIFNKKFFYLSQVVFDKITLEFSDEVSWLITKEFSKDMIPILKLYLLDFKTKKPDTKKFVKLNAIGKEDFRTLSRTIYRQNPYLRQIAPNMWEDRRIGMVLSKEEVMARYGNELPFDLFSDDDGLPKWVEERIEANNVSLIKTQRLLYIEDNERDRNAPIKTVERYSLELSKHIKTFLAQSTELSSKLDRTYPNRLIKRINEATDISLVELTDKLKDLEAKRELLDKVGLIEIDKDSNILDIDKTSSDVIKEVLMLYVEDSFNKLAIFDGISRKIEILLDIINKRFKHKKLYIDKDKGFLLKSTIVSKTTQKQMEIPVDKLSSGEQNELVLFYELLFKSKSNSLILIDEPEISLHISWQNSFIDDLKEIAFLNNLEILIATHSPDIIANNWDLMVELKE